MKLLPGVMGTRELAQIIADFMDDKPGQRPCRKDVELADHILARLIPENQPEMSNA